MVTPGVVAMFGLPQRHCYVPSPILSDDYVYLMAGQRYAHVLKQRRKGAMKVRSCQAVPFQSFAGCLQGKVLTQ